MAVAIRSREPSPVSRRVFLRGAGLSLALPWMESLPLRGSESGKLAIPGTAAEPPVRFACIYFSNGVEPEHWWAKGSGSSGASTKRTKAGGTTFEAKYRKVYSLLKNDKKLRSKLRAKLTD